MRTLIDEVVNLKDITQLWSMVLGAWFLECSSTYASNHYLAVFYVSFNVLLRALSFRTPIANHQILLSNQGVKQLLEIVFMNCEHVHWGRYSFGIRARL